MITALLEPVDELTRRRLIGGAGAVAAGLLLAGCATGAPAGTDTAPDRTWSFTDDRQETVTLPARPQRLAMQEDAAGALLPFGIRPSAVFGNAPLIDSPQFQDQDIAGIEEVGTEFGVINLEKLAALDPDVVVVPWSDESPDDVTWMGFADQAQFELARQIAPIVAIAVTDRPYSQVIDRFIELAGALGVALEAPRLVAMREEFEAAREDLRAAAGGKPGLQVMAVSPTEDLVIVFSGLGISLNSELREYQSLGLTILDPGVGEISWETIGEQPADVILVDSVAFVDDTGFLATHPIWPTLPAVDADQVGKSYSGTIYRMPFFTEQLRELTALVALARHRRGWGAVTTTSVQSRGVSRRGFLVGSASLGAILAGCGRDPGGAPAAPADAGFPRTVATSRGPVEIPTRPERIVTLAAEVDAVVALGLAPAAMVQSFNAPTGIDPWLEGRIDPATVMLLDSIDGIPFEQVAGARPDVILAGTHFGIDDDHATLVGIAPVVTTVKGLTEDTWQDQTLLIGEALGEEPAAARAVADIEGRVEEIRAGHPEWAGRTFASASSFSPGSLRVGAGDSFGPRFLESLGLALSPEVTGLPSPDISVEQLGLLDADLLLMTYGDPDRQAEIEANPLFADLPVVREGRVVTLDIAASTALTVPSVLRVGYVLDQLVPQIETRLA